jgi:hypothetical protein
MNKLQINPNCKSKFYRNPKIKRNRKINTISRNAKSKLIKIWNIIINYRGNYREYTLKGITI